MKCCKGCEKRTMRCHAECPEYKSECAENRERLRTQNRQKQAEWDMFEHIQRVRDRAEKRKRKK